LTTAPEICQWLENTHFATALRQSLWVFPLVEGAHVLGLALSVGPLIWMDLRLLGWGALRNEPVSKISAWLLPWSAGGFALMFLTGGLLFCSQALDAYRSVYFRIKVTLLLLAGINALVYHLTVHRRAEEWDESPVLPRGARIAGLFSLLLWAGVITAGRTMAYNLAHFN
jgi:hypothetical protein